ncbi:hypothetical protein D915_002481 [Fasciola hepatica]|uniref:Uncharacterized protein n=1 Tax=Fasciola hepatica TaxID=6192 RepID=A0A4E0RJD0_FASHE|nr:hypothetical protein D915_002481 [Fasciola hepatica]
MVFNYEFLVYTLVYIFGFYGCWYSVYLTSHEYMNLSRFVSLGLVEVREFLPSLGRWFKYITQDVSMNGEWNNLFKCLSYCSIVLLYLPISIMGSLFSRKIHQFSRIIVSTTILWHLMGMHVVLSVLSMTLFFFLVGWICGGYVILVWTPAIFLLYFSHQILEKLLLKQLLSFDVDTARMLYGSFYSLHLMALLRATSLGLFLSERRTTVRETNEDEGKHSQNLRRMQPHFVNTLLDALEFSFYLPTIVYGPLCNYEDWHNFIYKKTPPLLVRSLGRFRRLTLFHLTGRAVRLLFAAAFWSFMTCTFYANAILSYPVYLDMKLPKASRNPWMERGITVSSRTLWSCLNLAGIGFYFFHTMIYGIPGLISDTEQFAIETVQGWHSKAKREETEHEKGKYDGQSLCLVVSRPSCVFRITLFTEMWRTFDRGLYNFMFVHIYLPVRGSLPKPENSTTLSCLALILRSILASSLPFLFVLLFHGITKANTIWITINIIQFYLEKFIRWSDKNTLLGRKLRGPNWIIWRHRLLGIFHATSMMSSLTGLTFFLFEYEVGMAFVKHILFSYGGLIHFIIYYGLYFTDLFRAKLFAYHGVPFGVHDAPMKKE